MTNESPVQRFRLFVAMTVPEAVRENVLCLQRELQPLAPRGAVRWTKPEQFHLTLRFLGDVSSGRVAALQQSLQAVCAGETALHLRAAGVGFFPNARSPRVVWIGINDRDDRLLILQKKVESAVQPFTAEPGGDRFAGHITLGRFKQFSHVEMKALTGHAEALNSRACGEWTASEIKLMQSQLSPAGARHSVFAAFRLGES